jgi:ribulose 1,5-bisphosphate carboxylase large subunit-like protein
MPTVAGGVYPGQLHGFYEHLGPKVAYFVGGAVALHKDGPKRGAEMCVRTLREAVELRAKAQNAQDPGSLPGSLIREIEEGYRHLRNVERAIFNYVPPEAIYVEYPRLRSAFIQ